MGTKATAQQIATVTERIIQGDTTREAGAVAGLSNATVSRITTRPEIRTLIEREATEIITRGLKSARRTITRLAAEGNVKDADIPTKKLSLDASKHITAIAGLSGNAPSTIINQLIQINTNPEQSRELDDIQAFLSDRWDTIDVTPEDATP